MSTYRAYFRNGSGIVGRLDFDAFDDDEAVDTAKVLCDACSDRCDSFEVWEGNHCIRRCTPSTSLDVDAIIETRQAAIADHEDAIQRSAWAIASSERLLRRLDELRALNGGHTRRAL